ncbi:MAG TPA: MFS transporter [Bacteroidales bacterium]|nr:MFS transporter [Bacteroidales bacterium]
MEKNIKKVINAWCSYDIANSAYNLVITSTIFPIYYHEVTQKVISFSFPFDKILTIRNTVLYDYTIAVAYLLIIMLLPLLSGIADCGGYKKRFMRFFTLLGAISCISLYGFNANHLAIGLLGAAFAVIGFAGSLVFYNSFLPVIASPEHHDKISARGFSWGYAGSVLLLLLNLIIIFNYQSLGFSSALNAMRFAFITVGIWWIAISSFSFYYLPEEVKEKRFHLSNISKGYDEIIKVFRKVKQAPSLKWFLLAFFFLSMGVQTIMLVATMFGKEEIHLSGESLIVTILLLQILGIIGATLFAKVSERKGNKASLIIMLVMWISICIVAFFIKTQAQFYGLAAAVGLIMGGIQSQSRSTYSKLIPATDTASYFSFYDVCEKFAIVLGMFFFGLAEHYMGNMRWSALLLSIFFIASLLIISRISLTKKSK